MPAIKRFLPRQYREPQPKYETCIFLDPGDEGSTIYWRGSLPQDALLSVDPYARSRSVADPGHIRKIVYFVGPAISFLLVFATAFLVFSPSSTAWLPSVLVSVLFGWEPGLLVAAAFNYAFLRPKATWLFKRVKAATPEPPKEGEDQPEWSLEPVAPRMPVPHIQGRPFVIRDDFMKRVSQQLAMRFTFRSRDTSRRAVEMTSLVVIAVGLFALIFLVNAMVSNNG
jgi:hypothetical protein